MRAHASPLPRVTVARVCTTAAVKSVFLFLSFGFTHNMTPCNSSASPTRSRAWMASCLSTILEQLRSLLTKPHTPQSHSSPSYHQARVGTIPLCLLSPAQGSQFLLLLSIFIFESECLTMQRIKCHINVYKYASIQSCIPQAGIPIVVGAQVLGRLHKMLQCVPKGARV